MKHSARLTRLCTALNKAGSLQHRTAISTHSSNSPAWAHHAQHSAPSLCQCLSRYAETIRAVAAADIGESEHFPQALPPQPRLLQRSKEPTVGRSFRQRVPPGTEGRHRNRVCLLRYHFIQLIPRFHIPRTGFHPSTRRSCPKAVCRATTSGSRGRHSPSGVRSHIAEVPALRGQ